MTNPETIKQQNQEVLQLLKLIESTHTFQRAHKVYFSMYAAPGASSVAPIPPRLVLDASQTELELSRAVINTTLRRLDGLQHYFDDPRSGKRTDCSLIEWHGYDPDNEARHLWVTKEMPGAQVSIASDLFDDLRQKYTIPATPPETTGGYL